MMHARKRRELVEQMIREYDEPLVRSLIETIHEQTDTPFIEATELVLTAWKRSKGSWIAESRTFRRYRSEEQAVS